MEIHNPRRILAVSLADSAQYLSDLIKGMGSISFVILKLPHSQLSSHSLYINN